jgi:tRNA pseudouridine38-40 synthase
MPRYAIKIEYIGTAYSGWQCQKNGISVQETLEKALSQVFSQNIKITGSGRTDVGVHAKGQVAHFDAEKEIKSYNLIRGVNVFLPNDIAVTEAKTVDDNFDARKSAVNKTYVYKMYISSFRSPFLDIDHKQIYKQPDITAMQKAAKYIEGKHDFKCFMSTGSNFKTTVREIYSCTVTQQGNEIYITVNGNAFLYNMVRTIAGTLLFVGMGKIPPESIPKIIESGNRALCGKTLSANGLTLMDVKY